MTTVHASSLLAEGETTLGCVDREGRVQPLPEFLQRHAGASDQPARAMSSFSGAFG